MSEAGDDSSQMSSAHISFILEPFLTFLQYRLDFCPNLKCQSLHESSIYLHQVSKVNIWSLYLLSIFKTTNTLVRI